MAQNQIGVTFIPSNDNQQMGPQRGSLEGPGGDLGAAFKIMSLHLPRVLGAQALAPEALLKSKGAAGVAAPAGVNPYSAVFEALLKAMNGGASSYLPPSQSPYMPSSSSAPASFAQPSYRPQPQPTYPSAPPRSSTYYPEPAPAPDQARLPPNWRYELPPDGGSRDAYDAPPPEAPSAPSRPQRDWLTGPRNREY